MDQGHLFKVVSVHRVARIFFLKFFIEKELKIQMVSLCSTLQDGSIGMQVYLLWAPLDLKLT